MPVGRGARRKQKSTSRYHKRAKRQRRTTGEIAPVVLLHLSPAGVECTAEIVDGSCSACGWTQPAKRASEPVTPPPPGSMTSVAARQVPDREREFVDKRKAKADREAKQRDAEAEAERLETLAQREANNEAIRSGRKKRRRKRDPFIDELRPY